ncbi:MXAN_6640 family putative metalloprotease [Archangium primigenium]|uniref:MXAN_6640 family putative metalloprotease n=1 Tax=[Archangium] primigenium TaxID=2792470 RepID=UPI001957A137|nr:MXAN_6640 family putative metalloprotease [Archangium primigenium]MBM7119398.1 hypothetical protein [Archangium primigenium]
MSWAAWLLLGSLGGAPHHAPPDTRAWGLVQGGRPTEPAAPLPRFAPEERVESVVSPGGRFRVHYTLQGPNAVKDLEAVHTVARAYDAVADVYAGLGYRLPPEDDVLPGEHGEDGRFDVYLLDFAGRADGAYRLQGCLDGETRCAGYMLQENDFAGLAYASYAQAVDIVASHEFFHAVQAAYHPGLGGVAAEGSAVWATERFQPALDDLERFSRAYLTQTDRSLVLDPDGPAQAFAYGAGLFFQYLDERYGPDVVRALWEQAARAPGESWPELLDTVLQRDRRTDFDAAFTGFAQWNLSTGARAGPGAYARGAGYTGLAPPARELPLDEPNVRVTAASTRYFQVEGGQETVSVSYTPREDAPAGPPPHLLVAAVTPDAVLRVSRAEGLGVTRVSARDATHVVVALVDGRLEGTGRYGRLCITGTATDDPCARDVAPAAPDDTGCHAAPGATGAGVLLGLGALFRGGRRRRAAQPSTPRA